MTFGRLRSYLGYYIAPHPSQQVRELFLSTAILDFAVCLVVLFEPIYLYSLGWSVPQILLFYSSVYVLYFFLLPIGGRISRRHGYEHTILFSSPFLVIWYLSFFAIPRHPAFIAVAVVALAMQKILYWPGYHANFATWSDGAEEGREVSTMAAISGLMATFAPAIGGLLIVRFGYPTLFIIVAALILLSNVPLLNTPERFEPKPFSYVGAMKNLFTKENRRRMFGFMGFGEELLALVVWPVFLVLTIPDVALVGTVVSFSMLVSVLMTLYIGKLSDDGDKNSVMRSGSFFTGAAWLVRLTVNGGFGAFLVDSFYRVSKGMVGVPLLVEVYDGARQKHVMSNIVFFEMALAMGKAGAALLTAALLTIAPTAWWVVFVIAALFSGLYALVGGADEKVDVGGAPSALLPGGPGQENPV